jgi:hypothetical protein
MEIKRRREAYVCEGEERERGKTKCVYKTTSEVQTMLGMERGISPFMAVRMRERHYNK